jgi:hypothetical protein
MSCDQTLEHKIRFSRAVGSVALVVLVSAAGLFPSGLAGAAPAKPLTTSNPTCSSLDTAMACVQAWANGITIDYTGVLGPTPPQPSQSVALNLVGGNATIDRAFNCVSETYSVFVPLTAGEWEGSSTLRTSSDPGSPNNTFPFDLVVGSPGSPLAPPTTCELSNEAGPSGTLVPPVAAIVLSPDGLGYWLADSDGTVLGTGDAVSYGDAPIAPLNAPIVGMAATVEGSGYWLVGGDGGVFSYGSAHFYGSAGGLPLNQPVVGMARTPDNKGYWLVAADGGIFAYGDASFYGSMGGSHLNRPIVGMAATPDGHGYYLVASDGGVFAFGDAHFQGSMGGQSLNQPVVGMSIDPASGGYWEVAVDGGIFSFDAPFFGSKGDVPGTEPIVGMTSTRTGLGYLLAGVGNSQAGSGIGVYGYGDSYG